MKAASDEGDRGSAPVLEVDEIDLVRRGRRLLNAVGFRALGGQHWALLGPNGAGKTTLLNLCGGRTHPTSGTVRVLGHQVGRVDLRRLRGLIGHVDPRHPAGAGLTLREVVLTGATGSNDLVPRWVASEAQHDRADRLLRWMGVGKVAEEAWSTLSQGERGRALIARALMPEPRLLLLDEPATGLDVAARERLMAALSELASVDRGLTTVTVTHHLEELPASTTHAALLTGGTLLAHGPVDEVLSSENISRCFGLDLTVTKVGNRWMAAVEHPENAIVGSGPPR
ncbi:ABC transporter ATP-binding protein [Micromonospora sp. NPDC050187]|uniref:ABC transporter ATP-binding protein n=1 Tax=Micromonospora sp. NPDC050187 TaxID=3364277 RepID=UPI0037AE6251